MSIMDPVVKLKTGPIRGVVEKHEDGFNYYSFKGVPYAEPPIGELRFEDPIPKKKWTEILDCKNFGPLCLQYDLIFLRESYDENCLHLNVFTRLINKPGVRNPVMVWFHGGNFMFGGADEYGPNYLIRKNIVLVTVNFRLGVLGFLNLEDEVAPGNQGLKDQVMALQWVRQNIQAFGGNPNNVTIFGVNAGSVSVHYLSLSPLAKGLFHKIIFHSSVMNNPWHEPRNARSNVVKLCSLLGKELVDSKEIVDFLKTVDTQTLLDAQKRLWSTVNYVPFTPWIDSKSTNPIMPLHPNLTVDQSIHLPCLVGHNRHEGSFLMAGVTRKELFEMIDSNFNIIFEFNGDRVFKRYGLNELQFRRIYYKSEKISVENLDNFMDYLCDTYFIEGIHAFARVQAERSSASTYLYQFSYNSPDSFSKSLLKDAPSEAYHVDDLPFLFNLDVLWQNAGLKKGTKDYRIMEQMTEMWTNFAAYGRPTIETSELIPVHWRPIADGTLLRYLNVDEDITMQYTVNIDQKLLSARDIKA